MAERLALFATPRARAAVLAVAALLVLARLGATDLWPPDEPRYARIADELRALEHGPSQLVLLRLHGEPYTQKPPLFYWLAALAGLPFGRVTELAARLPSAAAGIATVAVTMALGGLLFRRGTGVLAGALLVTTIDWSYRARTVQLDTLLALCETAALLAFWRIEAGAGARRRNVALLHGALGLAVLAKGPVGWIVPLLAIAAYLAWERRLRDLPSLCPPWALLLGIAPGLAWIGAAIALAPPGFFERAVVDNLFGRAFAGTAHARPWYFYFAKFPQELLPWLVLLPATLALVRRALADPADGRAWRFLLAWIATTWLFFSLSSGKRVRYLLPIEPAFALLFAATLERWLSARARVPRALAAVAGLAAIAVLGGAVALALWRPFELGPVARPLALGVAAIVAGGALGWWWLTRRGAAPEAHVALLAACVAAGQLLAYAVAIPALDRVHSPRPIAETVAELSAPDETVGFYRAADRAHAVAYYAPRKVEAFRSEDRLAAFVAAGGRVLVFEEKRLAEVQRIARVTPRARVAIGGEAWAIAIVLRD